MKTHIIKHAAFIILGVILLNCKGKQGDPGPVGASGSVGATGPVLSGNIHGTVVLTSSNGMQPTDRSGVIVKTNKGDSTTTNSAGGWTLSEVTGTYALAFSKIGYGSTMINGYNFAGGGDAYINSTALSQTPAFTASITLDTIGGNSTATKDLHINVNLSLTGSKSPQDLEFFVYYGTISVVSTTSYLGMVSVLIPASQTSCKTTISGADFLNAGILPGQTAYVVAYPSSSSPALASKYVDESTGKIVYTSLGQASAVQNTIVPQ